MAADINTEDVYPLTDDHNIFYIEEIISHTLKYLPMKSLHTCARVCKRWENVVKKLKRTRQRPTWLVYNSDSGSYVNEQIGSKLKDMASEPRHALVFCSTQLSEKGVAVPSHSQSTHGSGRHPRAAKMDKIDIVDYLRSVLPSQCHLVSIAADGIVATSTDTGAVTELESSDAASCLLLPHMGSVDIVTFSLDMQDLCQPDDASPDTVTLLKTLGIPDSITPRLMLLLGSEQLLSVDDSHPIPLLLKHYGNVVLAGGLVDDLLPQPDDMAGSEPDMYGIAFCGGDDLQVASVVLDSSVRSQADAEAAIRRLERTHIRQENSIAFMFSCIGRGEGFYHAPAVDSRAFRKVFKTTPLLGFFGNGEIGYDYLPDYSKGSDRNYSVTTRCDMEGGGVDAVLPEIHHSYSTVIAMLSWQPA